VPKFRTLPIAVLASLAGGPAALADGGPDFYRIVGVAPGAVLALRETPSTEGRTLAELPAGSDRLRNLGCTGQATLAEWEAAAPAQRETLRQSRWCRVEAAGLTGWLPGANLAE